MPCRIAGRKKRNLNKADTDISAISNNNVTTRGDDGNTVWIVESGVRASAVSISCNALARKCCNESSLGNKSQPVIIRIGHNNEICARRGDRDASWEVEARGCGDTVGKCSASVPGKCCDETQGRYKANAVVERVGHHNVCLLCHRNPTRIRKSGGGAYAVSKTTGTRTSERCDSAQWCNKSYTVVEVVRNDGNTAERNNSNCNWPVKPRHSAHAVNKPRA